MACLVLRALFARANGSKSAKQNCVHRENCNIIKHFIDSKAILITLLAKTYR